MNPFFVTHSTEKSFTEGIPICSLFRDDENDVFGDIDWNSWDRFINILIKNSLYVKKAGSLFPVLCKYKNGFLIFRSLLNRRVVCVKGIECCSCISDTVLLETAEYGYIQLSFKKRSDALVVARIVSGFARGIYDIGLP